MFISPKGLNIIPLAPNKFHATKLSKTPIKMQQDTISKNNALQVHKEVKKKWSVFLKKQKKFFCFIVDG